MKDSILIEVDEMTKGILETLEDRMSDGARRAVEDGMQEVIDQIDSAKLVLVQGIDGTLKQSKAMREQMEKLQADVSRTNRYAEEAETRERALNEQLKQFAEQSATANETLQGALVAFAQQISEQLKNQAVQSAMLSELCIRMNAKLDALEEQVQENGRPFWQRLFGRKVK